MIVDIAELGEAKSDQLRRLLEGVEDEYLMIMEEDFFIVDRVSSELVDRVYEFCIQEEVDRFTLQSKNVYAYSDWAETGKTVEGNVIYEATPKVRALFGLDASVWKKSFLLKHLGRGQSDGDLERKTYKKICSNPFKIYALDKVIIRYRDAVRGGEQVIWLEDDPLRIRGNIEALFPPQ